MEYTIYIYIEIFSYLYTTIPLYILSNITTSEIVLVFVESDKFNRMN